VRASGAEHASTPLGWATSMGRVHAEVATYLLEQGAEAEFFPCVALGRLAEVRAALAADPRLLENAQGPLEHHRRPLHLAVLASQLAMVSTFLPAFLLSGFMFAISVMPAPLRAITYLVPARYFLVVTRGIFLKGVGIPVLRVDGLLMVAYAAVGLALAVMAFKKELR